MTENLNKLIDHRDAILLAEIGALIHDLGKLSEEFVKEKSEKSGNNISNCELFSHELILGRSFLFMQDDHIIPIKDDIQLKLADIKKLAEVIKNPRDKSEVRTITGNLFGITLSRKQAEKLGRNIIEPYKKEEYTFKSIKIDKNLAKILNELEFKINNEKLRLADLIACHGGPDIYWIVNNKSKKLLTLFQISADVIDSGIDKGAVSNTNKQTINHTYISTSFGYEFERIEVGKESLKKLRKEFVNVLEQLLIEINSILSSGKKITAGKWIELRNKIIEKAKECFSHALGETRRSANDVTLWDHSYSTASLYKTALAEIILSDQWKDPAKLKWKLLLIRFKGLDYIFKSVKIGDIEGIRLALKDALDKTKELLEVIVPIGNEIYRDENGAVYLIPEFFNENILKEKFKIESENYERSLYNEILKIFEEETKGELSPKIEVSEEKSRGAQILGFCLEKYKQIYNQPFLDYIKSQWDGKENKVVCTICGLKPADRKEKVCEDCKSIRKKRVEEWEKNRNATIWIDEICDENGRVGIIIGSFNLKWWLNGMWLNTCFTKTLDCLKKEKPEIFAYINSYEDIIEAVEEALAINNPDQPLKSFKKSDGSNILVKELLRELGGGESYHNQSANDYFEAIVLNREEDILKNVYDLNLDSLSNREKAQLLVLALMRKNPSFARIRRIWETCAKFWKDVENEILNSLDKINRYKIVLDENSKSIFEKLLENGKLKKGTAYEIRCKGLRVPIIIVNNKIIVIEALETLEIRDRFKKAIKDGFEIWEPSEYSYYAKKIYPQTSDDPKLIGKSLEKDSSYKPYIPILTDIPTVFICLIPLEDSWEIIKKIKTLYEIELSKVQNKLSIKLGLIALKRKFPLYIALESAKRFLNENIEEYCWVIESSGSLSSEENCERYFGKLGKFAQKIKIRSQQYCRCATIYMGYSLGDPNLKDKFYPYFIIENQYSSLLYKSFVKGILKRDNICFGLKHIKDLKEKDKIIFIPSIFDFEFLDSNVRRFDMSKERKHWLFTESENNPKPYLLWDIDNFDRLRELIKDLGLTTTQVMNFYEILVAKLKEWNIYKPPIELLNSHDENEKKIGMVFEKFVDNTIKSVPLRLKIVNEDSNKGKISKENFKFLKNTILTGLFFDFVDLWHTILKFKFDKGGEKNE